MTEPSLPLTPQRIAERKGQLRERMAAQRQRLRARRQERQQERELARQQAAMNAAEPLAQRALAFAKDHPLALALVAAGAAVAGPLPDSDAAGAVRDGLLHRQVGGGGLLTGDHDVDVLA